jgi:hypothetical protein
VRSIEACDSVKWLESWETHVVFKGLMTEERITDALFSLQSLVAELLGVQYT